MTIAELPQDKKIVLYDGICALCNRWVKWIIARDKHDLYRFVSQESELGQMILNHIGIDTRKMDGIVLYRPGWAYYQKSQAVTEILSDLTPLGIGSLPLKIIPTTLRDWGYDYIAKTRYERFGKYENCPIPAADIRHKFLYK